MLTRESLRKRTNEQQTQTVSRQQLDKELDTFFVSLREAPTTAAGVVTRLEELASHANTLVDIAQTLIKSEGFNADIGGEVLFWTEAARASIKSVGLDVELLKPWSLLAAAATLDP